MDNVQKHNNFINIPLSQTFRSYYKIMFDSAFRYAYWKLYVKL
jgi:hypothetical protein